LRQRIGRAPANNDSDSKSGARATQGEAIKPTAALQRVDPARSVQMSLVRARDTKPELRVRRALHTAGLRYRLHAKDLPGKPDVVFRARRMVVFIHGCFWHQHPDKQCRLARMPKSRLDFWEPKLRANRARDIRNKLELETQGWTVLEIWECEIDTAHLARLVRAIAARNITAKRAAGRID
jgi:DNA mismatch endonuclease, patch repair protein